MGLGLCKLNAGLFFGTLKNAKMTKITEDILCLCENSRDWDTVLIRFRNNTSADCIYDVGHIQITARLLFDAFHKTVHLGDAHYLVIKSNKSGDAQGLLKSWWPPRVRAYRAPAIPKRILDKFRKGVEKTLESRYKCAKGDAYTCAQHCAMKTAVGFAIKQAPLPRDVWLRILREAGVWRDSSAGSAGVCPEFYRKAQFIVNDPFMIYDGVVSKISWCSSMK